MGNDRKKEKEIKIFMMRMGCGKQQWMKVFSQVLEKKMEK